MMDFLDQQHIRNLLEQSTEPALSIYMPTHRGGNEAQQDPVRLKNAIVEAEKKLSAAGHSTKDAQALLEPCRRLLNDNGFWRDLADGLVLFVDPNGMHRFRLPFHFDDLVVVSDRFHVGPLTPFLNRSGDFYLLTLSEQQVRLFRGNAYGLRQMELLGVPGSMQEAFQYDDPQFHQQWHTRTSQTAGPKSGAMRQAVFHGHGGGEESKQDRDRFIRVVDRTLNRRLNNKDIPLLLASVDHSYATYRSVNTYPGLLDRFVQGNPEHLNNQRLWERAWPIVEQVRMQNLQKMIERYVELAHTDGAGHKVEDVAARAFEGRIDSLIVAIYRQVWGTFDPQTLIATVHPQKQDGDRDLLEFAAGQTLLNGGDVYGVEAAQVPSGGMLAAVYRY